MVEAIDVCPFQNLATLNDRLTAELDELQLSWRITFNVMQCLHLTTHDRHLLDCEFRRIFVVRVAFVVPHVACQLILGLIALILFFSELSVLLLLIIEVAFVVATCRAAMVFPDSHANPAELIFALIAGHVVTSLVLFDGFAAARALLRVGHDPGDVLRLGVDFNVPFIGCLTVGGPVCA